MRYHIGKFGRNPTIINKAIAGHSCLFWINFYFLRVKKSALHQTEFRVYSSQRHYLIARFPCKFRVYSWIGLTFQMKCKPVQCSCPWMSRLVLSLLWRKWFTVSSLWCTTTNTNLKFCLFLSVKADFNRHVHLLGILDPNQINSTSLIISRKLYHLNLFKKFWLDAVFWKS